MSKRNAELPEEVKSLGKRLAEWRGQRPRKKRIPEELWKEAAGLARRHGLNRISHALGLDYYHLKKRSGLDGKKPQPREDVFVELQAAVSETGGTCVVELEKGNGAKLKVSVSDAATVDWCQMKEAFLGA